MQITKNMRRSRARTASARLADRAAWAPLEQLENRQLLALAGVALSGSNLPLEFFDVTGTTVFDASTGAFDINASPTSVRLPPGVNRTVWGAHGDVQLHIRVNSAGNLIGGTAGNDFIVSGIIDDGNGIRDPHEFGTPDVLLTGEVYAFGWLNNAGPTDAYDFRFVPTGGSLLSLYDAGEDIGLIVTSEHSNFGGDFTVNFDGGAKGTNGPIAGPAPASVAGTVYCDRDESSSLSTGDVGLAGVPVFLTGVDHAGQSVNLSTDTLADGTYSFTGLRPGTYQISETSPVGPLEGTNTVGTAGGTIVDEDTIGSISLTAGVNATDYNFGYRCLGEISGTKFKDLTGNGLSPDDTPLAGTVIFLDTNGNGSLDVGETSTTTGPDGSFRFQDLAPGVYVVSEVVPAGYQQTAPASGSYTVTLSPSEAETGKNFANRIVLGSLSGTKFFDDCGNGLTSDDAPLAGTTIYLDTNGNGVLNSGEPSTVTGPDGTFLFENLAAGTYIVREVVPEGMVRTGPVLSDNYTVTLSTGQSVTGLNFANAERGCDCSGITNITYSVNGTNVYTNLRGNTNQGDVVTVTFTIPAGGQPSRFTLVSYTAAGATFVASQASQQRIYDLDTGVFGPGTYQLTVNIPDCYYQIDFVCGCAIDRFGPAGSNIFYSAQDRLISADNDGTTATISNAASISGTVWLDGDNDGVIDASEMPIQGAKIVVSWVDNGTNKSVTRYTDGDGRYEVGNLKPGLQYKVTETQPSGYNDGVDVIGSAGGVLAADRVSNILLGANVDAVNYNFGERSANDQLGQRDTAALSFWTSTAGQNLIKSLNGGSASALLGVWLGENFPNLFGDNAGSFKLKGKSNSQIASAVISRANNSTYALEAQVLATALSVYVTNSGWAGGTMASSYGFTVNLAGSGLSFYGTGSSGTWLGVPNNSSQTLLRTLQGANSAAASGIIYSGNSSARTNLFNYFRAINQVGGIS